MGFHTALLIGVLTLGLLVCAPHPGTAVEASEDLAEVAWSTNQFAADLYAHLQTEPGNLFFSPYSILTAMAMTSLGAREETANQMARVLHVARGDDEGFHQALAAWGAALSSQADAQKPYDLYLANALWGQEGYAFLEEFTARVRAEYGAELTSLAFDADPAAAACVINDWVKEQTRDKIPTLLEPHMLNQATTLVLTNAIYFKGNWTFPFTLDRTQDASFSLLSGDAVMVPMMRQTAQVNYVEDADAQVLELPYDAGEEQPGCSMVFFLPKDPSQFSAFEARFSAEYIQESLARFQRQKVSIGIPRFTIEAGFSLVETLNALGMQDAFSSQSADFSGMTGQKDLYISDVVHKAFLEVNEEGSEAAGATGVVMSRSLAPHPSFLADHPFLLLIRDNRTGGILFVGRMLDPRA